MKVPDYCIEDLNDIIKSVDKLNAGDLFLAYKRLKFLEDRFVCFGVSVKDPNFERLLKAEGHVDLLLIRKLAEYEVLEQRIEYYESKS